jgi:putative transposase
MFRFIGLCLGTLVRLLRARRSLLLENLALRQQLAVLKHQHPRPRLDLLDKLFWVAVRRFWSGWQQSVIVVRPETVVRWHRAGFRLYWKLISKVGYLFGLACILGGGGNRTARRPQQIR